jgi:hypothetical protein
LAILVPTPRSCVAVRGRNNLAPAASAHVSSPRFLSLEAFGRRPQCSWHRPWWAVIRNPAHVWTAPGWQEFSSRKQQWSEQPCVRPVSAVHVTAGHNALRGSGPGQIHAFDNALAHVGCPDRRIDRLCITCCSPFPTVTSRRMPDVISFTPRVRRVPCSVRPWSSLPMPFGPSCWRARWQRPLWAGALTTP